MSKIKCEVVRDLMPLVIDEAASEESAQCVHQHVDRCESCRIYYDGMKHMSDSRKAREEEERSFALAAQKMKKNRRKRLVRNVLIGMLIGCIMAYGGLRAWSYLTMDYTQLVHYDFYGVTLSELETGEVSVNIDFYGSSLVCGVDFERTVVTKGTLSEEQLEDNFQTLIEAIRKAKPAAVKGQYLKSVTVATTMGPGIKINPMKLG